MPDFTVDENARVSAGELREMGVAVPEDVPDCGWVPRASLRIGDVTSASLGENGLPNLHISIEFTEPFRWVEVSGRVKL